MTCFLYQMESDAIFFLTLSLCPLTNYPTNRLTCFGHRGRMGQGKVTFTTTSFFNEEIYICYSAAIPGKLLDHLAPLPPQRQPWSSQKTSIQKLLTGFDQNNWQHLSLSPTQYLNHRQQHKHLRFQKNVVDATNFIQVQCFMKSKTVFEEHVMLKDLKKIYKTAAFR